ncbi:MAG: phosphatase domain-containing protein [Bacteriovoracaceae bacterium]
MKKIILTLFVIVSFNSFAGITIVSDLDDTIKITNSGKEVDATINAFFTKYVFVLIPEFFKAASDYSNELHVVSASPFILKNKVDETFKKHQINVDSLVLRNPFDGQSKLEFKVGVIKAMMEKTSDDFIFLGDDVGQDPEVYAELNRHFPSRVLATYIHVIKGRKLPEKSTPYWTSYDLYLREYIAGRMPRSQVEAAAEKMLTDLDMKLVIPGFANCPKTPAVWLWQLPTIFFNSSRAIISKLNKYCVSDHSDNFVAE